jgi:hypothetical protein
MLAEFYHAFTHGRANFLVGVLFKIYSIYSLLSSKCLAFQLILSVTYKTYRYLYSAFRFLSGECPLKKNLYFTGTGAVLDHD